MHGDVSPVEVIGEFASVMVDGCSSKWWRCTAIYEAYILALLIVPLVGLLLHFLGEPFDLGGRIWYFCAVLEEFSCNNSS